MAKLLEKNGAEMCAALASMAIPIKSFLNDEKFMEIFKKKTKEGLQSSSGLAVYAEIVPMLFGDKHRDDTLQILAIIEGTTVSKMLKMNGTELMKDALDAWNNQIGPFFTQLGLSVST